MHQVPDSAETAPITVAHDGDQVRILVGDRVVVTGADISALVEAANALGDSDPLLLRAGASLRLDLPRAEKASVLEAVWEHSNLTAELWERDAELDEDYGRTEVRPAIETGIFVDGQPWGWLFLMSEDSVPADIDGRWQLVPAGPSETILTAGASFWGSMVSGPYKDIGIRRWSDLAAVSWYEVDEGPTSMWVDYEVEDWDKLFLDAFSGFFDGQYGPDRPFCPACEVTKDWAMYIDADPMFSDELIGEAMTELYGPCAEHRDMVDVLIVREIAGHDWRWTGTSWTPSELTSLGESEGATDLPGDEPAQVAGPPTAAAVPVQKPHSYRARLVGKTSGRPEYVAQSMGLPVPPAGSPFFPDINEFALTYNAYSRVSGVRTAAQIGNGARARYRNDGSFPDDLDELRAALFFEQRRYHHFGEGPDGADLDYIQALVGAIRRISGGAVPGPADPLP
jgi:hypothetical protein